MSTSTTLELLLNAGVGVSEAQPATDPNAGPLFVLLACAVYALVPSASE